MSAERGSQVRDITVGVLRGIGMVASAALMVKGFSEIIPALSNPDGEPGMPAAEIFLGLGAVAFLGSTIK